jgi:hypothetical protein
MRRPLRRLFLCLLAAAAPFAPPAARATETDQFTLPPKPLDDIGRDVGALVIAILRDEVAHLNARIAEREALDPKSAAKPTDEREFVARVQEQTGVGVPEATLEREVRYGNFGSRNVRFKPAYADSIYAWIVSPFPLAHLTTDCPTVRLYGINMGTDKIGHLFQQGYEYLRIYETAIAAGTSEPAAIAAAVRYGTISEKGLYGLTLTGVYSNGDLAADYAGFKFYRNLFHEVRIGERALPPLMRREGTRWTIDPARDDADVLKPFVTEHLNEALNPSWQAIGADTIRRRIRDRCARWKAEVPGFDEASYRATLERVRTWYGEPYGWELPPSGTATLLECFPASAAEAAGSGPAGPAK